MNVTRAALLERAESFRAELTARAPEFERARRLPPDMAACRAAGHTIRTFPS